MELTVNDIRQLSTEEYIQVYDLTQEEYYRNSHEDIELDLDDLHQLDLLNKKVSSIEADDYIVCNIKSKSTTIF